MTRNWLRLAAILAALAWATAACYSRPALTFTPDALPDAAVGLSYSAVIMVAGNQTPVGNISADSGLPPGLSLEWVESADRNRADLNGTPTTAGTYQLTISAWCLGTNVSGQTGTRQYTLIVR